MPIFARNSLRERARRADR